MNLSTVKKIYNGSEAINAVYHMGQKIWPADDWPSPYFPPPGELYDILDGYLFAFGFFQLSGYTVSGLTYREDDVEGEGGARFLRIVQFNSAGKVYDYTITDSGGEITVSASTEDRWTFLLCLAYEFYLEDPGNIFNQFRNGNYVSGILVKDNGSVSGNFIDFSTGFTQWFGTHRVGMVNYDGVGLYGVIGKRGTNDFNYKYYSNFNVLQYCLNGDESVPFKIRNGTIGLSSMTWAMKHSYGSTFNIISYNQGRKNSIDWDVADEYNITFVDDNGNIITRDTPVSN